MEKIRKTPATVSVLRVMCVANGPQWGLQIVRDSGRPAGSVYPILARLEAAGWARSNWETDSDHGGPRRRYYQFTPDGREAALAMTEPATSGPAARPANPGLAVFA
jgi:PadR family transcriptional regulator PadR